MVSGVEYYNRVTLNLEVGYLRPSVFLRQYITYPQKVIFHSFKSAQPSTVMGPRGKVKRNIKVMSEIYRERIGVTVLGRRRNNGKFDKHGQDNLDPPLRKRSTNFVGSK